MNYVCNNDVERGNIMLLRNRVRCNLRNELFNKQKELKKVRRELIELKTRLEKQLGKEQSSRNIKNE